MKTTDASKSKSKNLRKCAVSTRAYDDFTTRIRSVLSTDTEACNQALSLLDASVGYDGDTVRIENCSIKAQIAFSIIKPEIDRAVKRSQAARERAARRKATTLIKTAAPTIATEKPVNSSSDCDTEPQATDCNTEPQATDCDAATPKENLQVSRRKRRERRKKRRNQKAAMRAISEKREHQFSSDHTALSQEKPSLQLEAKEKRS